MKCKILTVKALCPTVALFISLKKKKNIFNVKLINARIILSRSASPAALSPRVRKREIYREVRSQIWGSLGKRQLHGWSLPLANTQVVEPHFYIEINSDVL